jgi:uncharacterized protein YgbK (DUF1537 family)
MTLTLGCIADDLTGGTDLASVLVSSGMRTVQLIGVPPPDLDAQLEARAEAVVIALSTRTASAAAAVDQSMAALRWLQSRDAAQIYFKYCSTFDSTDAGNIGPVADALLAALGADFTVVCPAFPDNRRTVYSGYLFVGNVLLSESPMRHHPLTPMTDANLSRLMGRQTARSVGLIPLPVVQAGAAAITKEMRGLRDAGVTYAIVDAIRNDDLLAIGKACAGLSLVTASSGLARGVAANFVGTEKAGALGYPPDLPPVGGGAAVLAGSCSDATRRQVAEWSRSRPAVAIDPLTEPGGNAAAMVHAALMAADRLATPAQAVLFYSSAPPTALQAVQRALGVQEAATLVEQTFAGLARELVARGVRRLVIAGGETSGAVVKALEVKALTIGPTIDPGVPWTLTTGSPRLALALKSGNFGGPDFFERALEMVS